ncbi:MAG: hypothetical protein R3C11_06435 [Planctomycetaceae bacterium]
MAKSLSHSAQSELISNFKDAVTKRVQSETYLDKQFGDATMAKAEQFRQALQHSQGEHQFRSEELRQHFERNVIKSMLNTMPRLPLFSRSMNLEKPSQSEVSP